MNQDPLNLPLIDAALLAEVELLTRLIIAASEVDVLTQDELDRTLGLSPSTRHDARESADAEPADQTGS